MYSDRYDMGLNFAKIPNNVSEFKRTLEYTFYRKTRLNRGKKALDF